MSAILIYVAMLGYPTLGVSVDETRSPRYDVVDLHVLAERDKILLVAGQWDVQGGSLAYEDPHKTTNVNPATWYVNFDSVIVMGTPGRGAWYTTDKTAWLGVGDLFAEMWPTKGWTAVTLSSYEYSPGYFDGGIGYATGPLDSPGDQVAAFITVVNPAPPIPGDVTCDGSVGAADLGVILVNYDATGAWWIDGDVTRDGTVDVRDLGVVLTHYDSLKAAPVPEPGTLILLLIGAKNMIRLVPRQHHWKISNKPNWETWAAGIWYGITWFVFAVVCAVLAGAVVALIAQACHGAT